ncbi:MAG: cytochrome c biogenesis protein CcsA [Candidatus Kapaibacterium sp.]
MKGLLIGGGVILGIVLGFWPGGLTKAKPAWWRWLTIISLLVLVYLSLGVPTGGTFFSARTISMVRTDDPKLPILGKIVTMPSGDGPMMLEDRQGTRGTAFVPPDLVTGRGLKAGDEVILNASFSRADSAFHADRVVAVNPMLALPLIPGLEERARNLYYHVPSAWLSQVAWFVAFYFAIVYLRKRRPEDDIRASSAAAIGALFCILATVTGAIWAKFNWGEFWNWDPRQISIFVVLIIYGAYFALRSALPNEDQRSRFSAVYLVLLALPVLFFLFVFPRMVHGSLHPGSLDDPNIGPVLSPQADALDFLKQVIFGLSMFGFSLLFFWMLNVTVRTKLLELRRERRAVAREERSSASTTAIDKGVIRLN